MNNIAEGIAALGAGKLIIYPTESVFGLGCDPFNESAVKALCKLKGRDLSKGLILLADTWASLEPYIDRSSLSTEDWTKIQNTQYITWVFPKTTLVPAWVSGNFNAIAVRVSPHPIAAALSHGLGSPIISTSANLSGIAPTQNFQQLDATLLAQVEIALEGSCGPLTQPTEIRDVLSNQQIRG